MDSGSLPARSPGPYSRLTGMPERVSGSSGAAGGGTGRGAEVFDLGDDREVVEQLVDAEPLQRRDLHDDGVAAPGLGHEFVFGQLRQHALRFDTTVFTQQMDSYVNGAWAAFREGAPFAWQAPI